MVVAVALACWVGSSVLRGGVEAGFNPDAPEQRPWTQARIKFLGTLFHAVVLAWLVAAPYVDVRLVEENGRLVLRFAGKKRPRPAADDGELKAGQAGEAGPARPVGRKLTLPEPFILPGATGKGVSFLPLEPPRPLTLSAGPPTTAPPQLPALELQRSFNSTQGSGLAVQLRAGFDPQRSLNST